jgi:hypothetical protein
MGKRLAVTLIVTAVLGVGLWFVLTNAHIDIFPCEKTEYDFAADRMGPPTAGTCSLMGVFNPVLPASETGGSQRLTTAGYALYALVVGLVPLLIGLIVGRRVGAPKAPSQT